MFPSSMAYMDDADPGEMISTVMTPLKDMGAEKIIEFVLGKFYTMWDTVMTMAGGIAMKIITIAMDSICASATVVLEWLCAGGTEAANDVWQFAMEKMRGVARKLLTTAVRWVVDKVATLILDPLIKAAKKVRGTVHS